MNDKKKGLQDAAKDIEQGLGGLFGALNEALGEMVSRLEDGNSGTVERNMSFDTDKGPVRAQAGVSVRMGGMDIGGSTSPKPVNPNRAQPKTKASEPRPLEYDLFEDEGAWILTADMPGVSLDDVTLSSEGEELAINSTGARQYATTVRLGSVFDLAAINKTLVNGVLTLEIPKANAS